MNKIESTSIDCLVGVIIKSIEGLEQYSEELVIKTDKGCIKFYHDQDCCESVYIEDFELDNDLSGAKIISAEEVVSYDETGNYDSATWTFYKIETNKGGLFIRWLGESNGYYSESVDCIFTEIDND